MNISADGSAILFGLALLSFMAATLCAVLYARWRR